MDEINKLKIICRKLSIPFWYCNQSHSYNEKYSLCFSVKKCNLRILCSLWNYYGEFNPNVLFQYFSFDDRDEIRVTCDSEEISSIVNFFLHPVLVLDTSLFTYFQNILSKLREEGVVWGYDLQYLMTGLLNQHPRTAIQFTKEKRNDYAAFYREVVVQD